MKIRVGIIGCGQIARHHLKTYATMSNDVEVVAVCDILESASTEAAAICNVANQYKDFRRMLAREDIDAIDVCLHNNLHRVATEESLKAGKHVYCEKPMAGSYRDAEAMLETARRTGKKLSIQLATLYANETRAARELIAAGELGEIYHARSTGFRRRGRPFVDGYGTANFVQKHISAGGALYDMGVYHIAQLLYLLGNPKVQRVSGKTYQKIDMDPDRRQSSGYNVEELGLGLVRFENDLTLDIIESWAIQLDGFEGSSIVGSKGGIRLNPFGFYRSYGDLDVNGTVNLESARFRWNKIRGDGEYYGGSQQHWIAALQGKVPLLPTAEIALNTMLISEAIYQSDKQRLEVTAEEVKRASVPTAVAI